MLSKMFFNRLDIFKARLPLLLIFNFIIAEVSD